MKCSWLKKEYIFTPYTVMAAWFMCLLLTNPFTNTFVNDDWVYARSVKMLLDTGVFRLDEYCGSSILAQVLWGAVFCVSGFSPVALKIATGVMTLAGIYFIFKTVRLVSRSDEASFWITCVTVLNPMFLYLSATFMTDIPFLVFSVAAVYFYLLAYNERSTWYFIPAAVFSILAILTRQSGMLLPLGMTVLFLDFKRFNWRYLACAGLSFLATLAAYKVFCAFITNSQGHLPAYFGSTDQLLKNVEFKVDCLMDKVNRFGNVLLLLGLLSIPLVFFVTSRRFKIDRVTFVVLAILSLACASSLNAIPSGNSINNFYVGPLTLKDVWMQGYSYNFSFSPLQFTIVKTLALGGILIIVFQVLAHFKRQDSSCFTPSNSLMFTAFCFTGFHLFAVNFFDRYFLLSNFLVLAAASRHMNFTWPRRVMAISCLVAMAGLSTVLVHDYFSWNKARFRAAEKLMSQGIKPSEIDAGYEFDGWHNYSDTLAVSDDKSWWWVINDDYLVCFNHIKGTSEVDHEPYSRWIDRSIQQLYVLKRNKVDTTGLPPIFTFNPNVPYNSLMAGSSTEVSYNSTDSTRTMPSPTHPGKRVYVIDSTRFFGYNMELHSCEESDFVAISGVMSMKEPSKSPLIIISNGGAYLKTKLQLKPREDGWYSFYTQKYLPRTGFTSFSIYLWNIEGQQILLDDMEVYKAHNSAGE